MKVTIRASHIAPGGGLTHLNQMIEWFGRLAPKIDFTLIAAVGQEELFVSAPENFRYEFYKFPSLGLPARIFWDRFLLPGIIDRAECDILFDPGTNGKIRVDCPTVSLLHNIAPFSDEYIAEESAYQRFRNRWLRSASLASLKSSSAIVFLSEYCREFFGEIVELSDKHQAVIYHGRPEPLAIPKDFDARERFGIEGEFLLCVSTIYRYKKLYELVSGYLQALERDSSLPPLLIAGETFDFAYHDKIVRLAAQTEHADQVVFLGSVDNKSLQALYANCKLFLFSSTLETCSIILIEALAHGCVMACSNKSVIPEICGDAAEYFDPYDPSSIADTILRLEGDTGLCSALSEKARLRSRNFSWGKAARQTLRLFEETLNGGAPGAAGASSAPSDSSAGERHDKQNILSRAGETAVNEG